MRTIYLVRHEEPQHSAPKRYLGITDTPLSPHGLARAERLRSYFAAQEITGVYHSGLSRARQTAEVIAAGRLELFTVPALHETTMGEWENLTFEEVRFRFPDAFAARGRDMAHYAPPGGESFAECTARVMPIFTKLAADTHGNIVVVAHAGVNRCILSALQGLDLKNLLSIPQDYGHINEILYDSGTFQVKGVNLSPESGPAHEPEAV